MRSTNVTFTNPQGHELAARLELPVNQQPHTYAIFAHCFTCSKNLNAVRNISRALNLEGIAVLRFDFTGLGQSKGEFSETNFSSNIDDLWAAAQFLKENYKAPTMLVGHSLGGTAVICAAQKLDEMKAVAIIGSPFDPIHVSHLFEESIEQIEASGAATVNIGGRPFQVTKQFLEDIREQYIAEHLRELRKPLLVLHSPQDEIVEVENARKIYEVAFHPKSFVSLDGADHLLTRRKDSEYVGEIIASWAKRYLSIPAKEELEAEKQVAVRLGQDGYTTEVMVRHHSLTADEPESVGGNDFGPTPYELVAAGLGTCTAMTMHMYARRKKWDLQEVVVHLDHRKDYPADSENMDDPKSRIDHFSRVIQVVGKLNKAQLQRLLEIADKCPVHRTMNSEVAIQTELRLQE